MKYTATIGDKSYQVEIGPNNSILINGEPHCADLSNIGASSLYSLLLDNQSWQAIVEREGDQFRISIGAELHVVSIEDERTSKIEKALGKATMPTGEVAVKAPMPGLVRGVSVELGQEVKAGQGLVILEAMKMENELRSPRAGTIKEIRVKSGERVDQGQLLVTVK